MNGTRKLYRRVKWRNVTILLLLIAAMVTWSNMAAFGGNTYIKDNNRSYQQVTVRPGDSLWKLIKENNPQYQGRMDKAVWKTQQLNQLSDSFLQTGTTLLIPIDL